MDYEKKFWSLGNNQLAKEMLGVDKFHKAGYKGKRVNMGNMETAMFDHPIYNGKVKGIKEYSYMNDPYHNSHGDKTVIIQHMVAPEATIYMIPVNSGRDENDKYYDKFIELGYDMIVDNNISICTDSGTVSSMHREELFNDLFENRLYKQTVCAHNSGWNGDRIECPPQSFIISGSVISERRKEFYQPTYATKGRPYRAMNSYVPDYTPSIAKGSKTGVHFEQGTSFSTPFFAGMLALVDDFFIDKVGRPLNYKEMTKFILDNAVPTDIVYDEQNYIFVLPDPKDINVENYIDDTVKPIPKPDVSDKEVIVMSQFKDVKPNRYSTDAIYRMVEEGLLKGYKDNTFKPRNPITREDFAVVLDRLIQKYLK